MRRQWLLVGMFLLWAVPVLEASVGAAGTALSDQGLNSSGEALQPVHGQEPVPQPIQAQQHTGPLDETQAPASTAKSGAYRYTFDGSPATAQPWRPADWDVTVHSRDPDTWKKLEPTTAHHGANCAGPPATHSNDTYEGAVFQCRDHVMTALNASGYGVIYLTPNYMVDFSEGEAVVRFDMSTLRSSKRDWIDLWITPYADNLQLPLDNWLPDLQGNPRNAVQVRMDTFGDATIFRVKVVRDFKTHDLTSTWWVGYESFLTPDASRRDTFELRLSRTRIAFGMPDYDFRWVDAEIPDLGWDQGVVQFGHHSYTPTKDCGNCSANTWHWDNVQIEPARPFTIIRGSERFVDQKSAPRVSFPRPAPANAHLRFAAYGSNIEVSFDEGATWQAARKQAQERDSKYQFRSYWTPAPQGISSVWVRGQGIPGDRWHARDFSIWAPGALSSGPPTQAPSTPTAAQPTAPPTGSSGVTHLSLVNADTDQPIAGFELLADGATLNLAALPTRNVNIEAHTSSNEVRSVRFALDDNSDYRTESTRPYALEGDARGDYYPWTPSPGSHTLTATPFSGASGSGTAGAPLSVRFNVVDQPTAGSPTPAPSSTPTAGPTDPPARTFTVEAAADAFVDARFPAENFGAAGVLKHDNSPVQQSFLRFDTGSFSGSVVAAKLRLYVTNPSAAAGGSIRRLTDTSWSERTVTYNSRPALDGEPLGGYGTLAKGTWLDVDVSAAVTGPGSYSFGLSQSGNDGLDFASREYAESSKRPQLVLTVE